MTVLALAYNGFKIISNFFVNDKTRRELDGLDDRLLRDIGMYREGSRVYTMNDKLDNAAEAYKAKGLVDNTTLNNPETSIEKTVVFIPSYLEDSGG